MLIASTGVLQRHEDSGLSGSTETEDLVLRAREGDRDAFDHLMVHYQRQVIGTATRVLGNRDEARDAAQEVFLKLFRNLVRIRAAAELRPWLYRVTINACRDIARKRSRNPGAVPQAGAAEIDVPAAVESGVDEELDLEANRRMLRAALETLPLKERAAVVLRDIEGLATEEAARILGVSTVTIRSQISRARVKIKRYCDRSRNQR